MKPVLRLHRRPNRRLSRTAFAAFAVASLASALPRVHAGTSDTFSTGSSLLKNTNYTSGNLPTNTTDVSITTTTTGLTVTAGAVTAESLYANTASKTTYTISNGTTTATNSTLTLGNSAGFTNANSGAANDLIALAGAASLTISGANSSTGTGVLGLTLASSGNFDNAGTGTLTISANISGTGDSLTFDGTGTSVLSGTNSFTGGLIATAGEVDVTSDASLGAAGGSVTINGGRVGFMTNNITIDPTRNFFLGANPTGGNNSGSLSVKGTITATFNGAFQNLNANTVGDLVKQGGGTLQLGGASTYSGSTFLNNGITQLTTANNRLPTGTTVNLGQTASANVGTLDLNGFNQQVAGLNSTSATSGAPTAKNTVTTSTTASTLALGGSGTYSYGDGTAINSGVITGAVSINKTGTGTQTFGDANTYTGSTTVSGGTLIAGTATSGGTVRALGGTSGVFVNGGGTLQMGAVNQFNATTPAGLTLTGTTAAAATLSVNGSSQGSTTAAGVGMLTLAAGSSKNVIDFNGKNGVVTFLSLATNGATLTINNYLSNGGAAGGPDELIINQDQTANLGNIVFAGFGNAAEQLVSGTAGTPSAFYEVYPTTTPVPEPSSWVVMALGALGLFAVNRSRRGARLSFPH